MSAQEQKQSGSFAIHPYRLFVYLLIGGITALFLSLSAAYAYSRVQFGFEPIKLPWIFLLNTLVLIASSYGLIVAKRDYKNDQTEHYKQTLFYVILLTLIFLIGQGYGWYQLLSQDIPVAHSNGASYLYLITNRSISRSCDIRKSKKFIPLYLQVW